MNVELLEKARARIPGIPVLVNLVSQRYRQLLDTKNRPLVKPEPDEDRLDTVLREIAEGKLTAGFALDDEAAPAEQL